jgi:MacB-like periplasmic core domain
VDGLFQDLKYAARKLSGAPAFALAAIATLAIGIGATTAIFSTVNATLLRPLAYPHSEDRIALHTRYVDGRLTTGLVAAVEIARLNRARGSIERAAASSSVPLDATLLRDGAPTVRATVHFVGEGFFDVFGVSTALRDFTHERQTRIPNAARGQPQGPPPVVVLSRHAWRDMFGGDPRIIGKTIRFAEITATAIGVTSQDLDAPHNADFWDNARFNPQDVGHGLNAIVRVRRRACRSGRFVRGPCIGSDRAVAGDGCRHPDRVDRDRHLRTPRRAYRSRSRPARRLNHDA